METTDNLNELVMSMHGDRITDEVREIQACLLGILRAIDQVCREHHLRYYIAAGTMLGAVRHGGFIPWDDDADIAMPRPDYETFLQHANEWLPARYELVSGGHPSDYPYVFARVQDSETTYRPRRSFPFVGGLPVDVFPLDGMAEPGLRRRWHYFRYRFLWKLLYFTQTDPYKHGKGLRSMLTIALRKVLSPIRLHRMIDNVRKEWSYESCTLTADHDYKPELGVVPREVFGQPTPIKFEDTTLMGVAQPDAYLQHLYGNYMEIPKDIPLVFYRYLNLKKPYRQYKEEEGLL
jgi:lipopolysaccharide cholinephosphotransferase